MCSSLYGLSPDIQRNKSRFHRVAASCHPGRWPWVTYCMMYGAERAYIPVRPRYNEMTTLPTLLSPYKRTSWVIMVSRSRSPIHLSPSHLSPFSPLVDIVYLSFTAAKFPAGNYWCRNYYSLWCCMWMINFSRAASTVLMHAWGRDAVVANVRPRTWRCGNTQLPASQCMYAC